MRHLQRCVLCFGAWKRLVLLLINRGHNIGLWVWVRLQHLKFFRRTHRNKGFTRIIISFSRSRSLFGSAFMTLLACSRLVAMTSRTSLLALLRLRGHPGPASTCFRPPPKACRF